MPKAACKYLDVVTDQRLDWKSHIEKIRSHNAGGAGGKGAEGGRQPPAATRPPRNPSSHNTVNVAPSTQQLIDNAATFFEPLDAPNGSSSFIQTSFLRAFFREAEETLTAPQQEHYHTRPQTPSSERSRQFTKPSKVYRQRQPRRPCPLAQHRLKSRRRLRRHRRDPLTPSLRASNSLLVSMLHCVVERRFCRFAANRRRPCTHFRAVDRLC